MPDKILKIRKIYQCMCMLALLAMPQICVAGQGNFENVSHKSIDLSTSFNGLNACAVFYTSSTNIIEIYNENLALKQNPPQSTFKIASTLLGLENGILKNEQSKMHYNGTSYSLAAWNKNVNLKEAFQYSCVWYFNQVVYSATRNNVRQFLQKLSYGNEDLTQWQGNGSNEKEELNGFWLSSSLKISALEQVQVLAKIFEGQANIDTKHIEILQNIMRQELAGQAIYAKTGSNMRGKSWFVGFVPNKKGKKYFAFYVDDPKGGISGAREIGIKYLLGNKSLF